MQPGIPQTNISKKEIQAFLKEKKIIIKSFCVP